MEFNQEEKQKIYALLVHVMNADEYQDERELAFLDEIKKSLGLDISKDIASSISLDDCKKYLEELPQVKKDSIADILKKMAWADGRYVRQEKELLKYLNLDLIHYELELIAEWRDSKQIIVGYYTRKNDGSHCFEDIRSLGFSELKYKDGSEIAITTPEIPTLKIDSYYEFEWGVELDGSSRGFHIIAKNNKFNPVNPKQLVDRLYKIWSDSSLDISKQMKDVQRMVNTQLTASSDGTFIYELLQNANDYPVKNGDKIQLVDVEFHLTDRYLIYRHSGRYFTPRNIAAISKMSAGEKKKEKNAIGYKGIGFKTVFSENQYVYLESGDYTLRFDESITEESDSFPWQIMPIWTPKSEVDEEVLSLISQPSEFRVQMAIRPSHKNKLRNGDKSFEFIFKDIFKDEKDILFIPNLKSVKVFYDGVEQICRIKDPEKWALTREPLVYKFSSEEIDDNNKEIISNKRIPEKYKDFEDTRVSFACRRDGRELIPVDRARIYCYLPTQVSLGFPFLMNTDMIPTGPRDDFEKKIRFNHKLMKIAGGKLAEWISDLLHCGEYDWCSVFKIVPDFAPVENYEEFIDEFKEGFDEKLEDLELIPCEDGKFSNIHDTIIDETKITSSGIMSDEEFLKFANIYGNLPAKELRTNKRFKSIVKNYIDSDNVFDKNSLREMVRRDEFQGWLKVQDNNNKFLKFLLDKGYLEDFLDEKIFLEADGGLYTASELYYDIDEYLTDLKAFTNHICYLLPATREFFAGNEDWSNVIEGAFAAFDCDDLVNDVLLSRSNIAETKQKLNDKETSIHFFKFLAENVSFDENYTSLPFFNDNDLVEDDFEDKFIFLKSEKGHRVFEEGWLASIDVAFVSPDYTSETKKYFVENFGVQQFSDEIVVKQIIICEDYHDSIVDDINEDYEISKSFVHYCYSNKEFFESGSLRKYPLRVYDINGENVWCLSEEHVYFLSDTFEGYAQKEWLGNDWMYSLDSDYFDGIANKEDFKKFIEQTFWVDELSDKEFYTDVVKRNLKNIIANTSGNNDSDGKKNIDFIKYLDDNYHLIFEVEKDADIFSAIILVSTNITDLKIDNTVYIYNQELADIIDNSWFPEDIVYICNEEYGNSKALKAIGCNTFSFSKFYDDVIVEELETINCNIDSKEDSIAFHNFIIEHLGELTTNQQSKMIGAKVYLYGNDEPAVNAGGHKILSAKAKELFEKGLVEFADLDLIDPEYKTEQDSEYWETRLENTKFTISHFYCWLKDNADAFKDTLQDVDLNIVFWRWIKDNVDSKQLVNLPALPIVLKDGRIDNDSTAVYFSDEYMAGSSIEQSVLKFDENALFISPDYIDEEDDVEKWKEFWSKIGIKYEIVDILIETIIPNLDEIEDEGLPKLIADNREALEKNYGEDDLISHLTNLRVKAKDGKFYRIDETIYIDCEKDEPFPYVELPNQISFKTREERELIKDIIKEVESDFVETLSEWQQRKLDRYLDMQDNDSEDVREFHYQFINDLSVIRNTGKDSLKEIENIKKIYLLNKDDEFCDPSDLTMGSVYKPFFDFEGCGITTLEYVNDSYIEECEEYPGRLFRALKVHCDIQKDDLDFLEDRECAIYFWSKYLTKKEANILRIKEFLEDSLFDDIACIPTKDEMKTPGELYYGAEVSRYVRAIEDWKNKIPLKDLPEIKLSDGSSIFDKLPFKKSLDFLDALYALVNITGQDRRTQLLQWMIDDYDTSYDEKIDEYREDDNAKWNNNKNEPVQIKQLYALDYWEKALEQYFGTNPRIVNKAYFPSGDSFKEACDILQIQTITLDDLDMQPVDKNVYSARDINHRLYALVFAAMINSDNWQELYDSYKVKLDDVVFYKCRSILIQYKEDTDINQALKKFYHKPNTTDFYFVKDLDDKLVYESYVKEFTQYLGIDEDDIPFDLAKIIMDSRESALEKIKEQNSMMLDEEFKDAMEELIPGIKRELSGNKAEEDDDDEVGTHRPSFTTTDNGYDEDDVDDNSDNVKDNEPTTSDTETKTNQPTEPNVDVTDTKPSQTSPTSTLPSLPQPTSQPQSLSHPAEATAAGKAPSSTDVEDEEDSGQSDIYEHIDEGEIDNVEEGEYVDETDENSDADAEITDVPKRESDKSHTSDSTCTPSDAHRKEYDPDNNYYMGAVDKDKDYQPVGDRPYKPRTRKHPKPFTKNELSRLRSHGTPLELESLEPTKEELDILAQCGISAEQIADTNYLAQLRLYRNLIDSKQEPEESMEDFVRNADDVTTHAMKGGRYIHTCSAARGVMYISPSVWDKMVDDKWTVCVYLDGKGKNFHYINSAEEFLKLVEKDDVVIKITGKEKVDVVNKLYRGLLSGVKGTAYTLIRVAARTNMDAVFAHYIGAMAETDDGNEDENDY